MPVPAKAVTIMPMRSAALLCTFLVTTLAAAPSDPEVSVTGGVVRGRLTSDGGAAFKGIPFAQPPVGDLRWREPQPVKPWEGVREASEFQPACTQLSEGWNKADVATSREDCLYLNVATPEWPPQTPRAVMFWIHGGSNLSGAGEASAFDERALVRRGIVWVTVNYRLGMLGFLAHPELTRESPHHSSGNYGLLDQIAALRWVHDNIAKFGGDPANVTIAGESAGAWDVSMLMTSPLARGLFHRAIQESGAVAAFNGALPAAVAEERGRNLGAALKAPETGAIAFLRTLPPEKILQEAFNGDRTGLFVSVDGWVLPESPAKVFVDRRAAAVPLITGTNAEEIPEASPDFKLADEIRKAYGPLADRALPLYGKPDPLYGSLNGQWLTDLVFRCPSAAEALWHARAGNPTYQYEFEQPAPGAKASVHAGELVFLFGTWDKDHPPSPADLKVSDQMQTYWVNFTRTGNPNGEGVPAWPAFMAKSRGYMAFTDGGAAAKANMRREACDLFVKANAPHR
jgi:para-nitrobenzyl esterase